MVRATAVEVVKKWGGTYPSGWTAASVGNICTQVDEEMNAKTGTALSTTNAEVLEFANMLVFRRVNHGRWAAGDLGGNEPVVWTQEMIDWFNRLSTSSTYDGARHIKGQGSS